MFLHTQGLRKLPICACCEKMPTVGNVRCAHSRAQCCTWRPEYTNNSKLVVLACAILQTRLLWNTIFVRHHQVMVMHTYSAACLHSYRLSRALECTAPETRRPTDSAATLHAESKRGAYSTLFCEIALDKLQLTHAFYNAVRRRF